MSLLPFRYKYAGWTLLALGAVLAGCYYLFEFMIRVPVFAVYSAFLETKIFSVTTTNAADELILLLFTAGFVLVIFSRERNERRRFLLLRIKAAGLSVLTNTALLALSILFVFGTGFMVMLLLNVFSTFILYLAYFHTMKRRNHTKV